MNRLWSSGRDFKISNFSLLKRENSKAFIIYKWTFSSEHLKQETISYIHASWKKNIAYGNFCKTFHQKALSEGLDDRWFPSILLVICANSTSWQHLWSILWQKHLEMGHARVPRQGTISTHYLHVIVGRIQRWYIPLLNRRLMDTRLRTLFHISPKSGQ